MADFSYVGSGGVRLLGCAAASAVPALDAKWALGTVLYNCAAARRGCLERVVLKRYRVFENFRTIRAVVLYVDTNNWWWNEDELCTRDSALAAVAAYDARQAEIALDALSHCNSTFPQS
jgi:hypothetical protein